MTTAALQKVNRKLTGNMVFFLFHLLLQVCQQRLALLTDGEGDCVEVVAGGLQSQSVQRQESDHRLAGGERAKKHTGGKGSGENIILHYICYVKKCNTFECHCANYFSA